MPRKSAAGAARWLGVLTVLLILKIVATVLSNYPGYFAGDFSTDFLRGREPHFAGLYRWAFDVHIVAGPASLLLGLILIAEGPRRRWPAWHRGLGRVQVGCVLLLVVPSGLVMARHAAAGPLGAAGLGSLAVATAVSVTLGTRAAVGRRFGAHRRWMWRCYVLLGSAVVIRVMGGAGSVLGVTADWYDPLATWASWLVPLAAFEVGERMGWRFEVAGGAEGRSASGRR